MSHTSHSSHLSYQWFIAGRPVLGAMGPTFSNELVLAASSDVVAVLAAAQVVPLPTAATDPLPKEFVWMPAGEHEISAFASDGSAWKGKVICDEQGARDVEAMLRQVLASGRRVYLDRDHKDEEATAWVTGFRWDPARGIVCSVEWTSLGEQLLRGKVYYSFSPAFLLNKQTRRVRGFPPGHAAGGLVNAPAFGAAMPALIAARLSGATDNPAPGGSPGHSNAMNKDLILAILAALAVQVPADATDEQLTGLLAKHKDQLLTAAKTNAELQAKLTQLESVQAKARTDADELIALRAKDTQRKKDDAKKAVEAAVARGALPAKDEAIQAKWRGLIEADPTHAELLAALPDNPALHRVTSPGLGTVQARDGLLEALRGMAKVPILDSLGRAAVYAKDISPLFAEHAGFGAELYTVLAANSLGTLTGEIVTQRSLSLLKREFPAIFALSTDFSAENASFDQTIKTRLRTIPTVTPYNAVTGYATSAAGTSDVALKIDAHNAVQIAFNANESASTKRDLFGEQVEGCHNAIGADLVDAVLALITPANFPAATHTSTIALAAFTRPSVGVIRKKLVGRKCRGNLFLLLNTDYHTKLGEDSAIVSLATFRREEVITDGILPRISKMQPYEVEDLPTTGNLVGFGGRSDALAVATRVPNDYTKVMGDVPSNGIVQIVTNPDTGISVMLVRFVDHSLGAGMWRLAYMRGVAIGNPACGERLISAAP